jgi:uncharacterized protein
MDSFILPTIPNHFQWKNNPLAWAIEHNSVLQITAGAKTDWFIDPRGDTLKGDAPVALFLPDGGDFMLKAKVKVDFVSTFDAGVLMVYEKDDVWGKLCFEFSPQGQPMIVSVVTKGVSDDCNSVVIDGREVYLRVSKISRIFAFHYSLDGDYWHMARYFTLGNLSNLKIGFSAQSPTGDGCEVVFSEIDYQQRTLQDFRSGE